MGMNTYKHIIWDWNGTLFDDAWLCRGIVSGMLVKRNKPALSEERYMEVFDFPVKDYYQRAGFDFSKDSYEVLAAEFINEYESRRKDGSLRKGAIDVLHNFQNNGIKQWILSAYKTDTLKTLVSSFNIQHFFSGIYGLDNFYAAGKADIGRHMMKESGIEPEKTVMIGDTTHDYHVSQELGIDCYLIPGGHHSRARLEQCGCKVGSIEEIINFNL
jgi:phosphoglycolate phosphatase